MKDRMNIIFYGSCFIAAILIEAFCIHIVKDRLFCIVGIGIVVLITGYLFMDSIRRKLLKSKENIEIYIDQIMSKETEKQKEQYTELFTIQKATYAATKKSTKRLEERFDELEELENNNTIAMKQVIKLQKKSLEGQKKALNMEINYFKEYTKRIINELQEVKNEDIKEQFSKISALLESNIESLKVFENQLEEIESKLKEEQPEPDQSDQGELQSEEKNSLDITEDKKDKSITPLYEDPNKNLTADEIAKLFASHGQ